MAGLFEEHYMYGNILALTKCIFGLIQVVHHCFKEYINTKTLKVGLKQCKTYPCTSYIKNKLKAYIIFVFIYDTLDIIYK